MVLAFWLAATYVPLIHTHAHTDTHAHTMGSGCRPFWGMLRSVCMKHVIMKLTIAKWLKATQPSTTRRPTQQQQEQETKDRERGGKQEECRRRGEGKEEESRRNEGGEQKQSRRPDKGQRRWSCPARLRSLVCCLTSRRSFVLCHIIHNPFNNTHI